MSKKLERMDKSAICDDCAKKHKDWIPPSGPVTATYGLCGYCKRKDVTHLIPLCDYGRPGKPAVWD